MCRRNKIDSEVQSSAHTKTNLLLIMQENMLQVWTHLFRTSTIEQNLSNQLKQILMRIMTDKNNPSLLIAKVTSNKVKRD